MTNLPWFALYCKPRHEKSVAAILQGKGYEVFLPTYTHRVKYHKTFELPLFPSYVFCRMEPRSPLAVISTPNVFTIIGNGKGPDPISEDEIQGIRRMVESGSTPTPWPYVLPGQEVWVESGSFKGVRGVIIDANEGKWLVLSVNLLQRSVAVRLDRESVSLKVSFRARATHKKLTSRKQFTP